MSEENSSLSKAQLDKERNVANNANNIRAAADVAAQTSNPYAKAIGTAVKVADKVSGGKSTEKLGKVLNTANKMSGLKGRMAQATLNKMSESGTSQRIASAMNKKNVNNNPKAKANVKGTALASSDIQDTTSKRKVEEETSDGGGQNFKTSVNFVKTALIVCIPAFVVVIFVCLFMSATQIYLSSVKLEHADSVSEEGAEEKINKKVNDQSDDLDTEIEDVAYVNTDTNEISSTFKRYKLESSTDTSTNTTSYLKRKYKVSDLSELEDFYPYVQEYGKDYDQNMVYDFFFKMYNLYVAYRDTYNVNLDLSLLMSTLNLQSTDMNVIFSSNLGKLYRTTSAEDIPKAELDYYADWSNYVLSKDDSEHDMEVLAQHMVSKQVKEVCKDSNGTEISYNILKDNEIGTQKLTCSDGQTYSTEELGYQIDNDKYKEFLKEFLEKKYYFSGQYTISGELNGDNSSDNSSINNTAASGSFRSWTQCGQSWSSTIVPKSSDTMCSIGCLITSITIQIARSGTATVVSPIDPGVAVQKFSFASGGNLYWNSVTNLAPNFVYKTKISLSGMNKASVAKKLNKYNSNKYYIVLGVSKKGKNKLHHYVALDYVDTSGNIYIMDPASTSQTELYQYYKIYTAHIYEKKD